MSRIVLASSSPRRAQLLDQIQLDYIVFPSDFDEASIFIDNPEEYVKTLAYKKAESIQCVDFDKDIILAADTVVVFQNQILEKPNNEKEAISHLMHLSGQTHEVYTGICLLRQQDQIKIIDSEITQVVMNTIDAQEIEEYIRTKEPFDKAGGYGIQGIGAKFVKEIHGDYFNVVGLPISKVYHYLKTHF